MCGVSQIAHIMSFASRRRSSRCCLSARRVASLDAPLSPSPPTRLGPRARGYARRRGSTEPPSSQRARRERVRASFYEGRSSSQTLLSRENEEMPEEGFETNRRVERVLGSQTPGTARSSDWAAVHVGENVARASSRRIGSHPIERQDHRRLRRSRFVSERQPHASRRDSSSRARTRGKRHRARRRSRRIRASPRIAAHPASDRGIFERSTRRARGSPGRGVSRWPPWARPARGSEARRSSPARIARPRAARSPARARPAPPRGAPRHARAPRGFCPPRNRCRVSARGTSRRRWRAARSRRRAA